MKDEKLMFKVITLINFLKIIITIFQWFRGFYNSLIIYLKIT